VRYMLKPLLALTLASGAAMTAHAQNAAGTLSPSSDGTLLNVSIDAESKRIPDVARLSAGVVVQASDGNTAMHQNAEKMHKVLAAIKAAGIAEPDVQTSDINLQPQYRHEDGKAPVISGYQASNTVSLKVRDISKLGKVLDTLAAQGANEISGPDFEVDQPEPAYDEARVAALQKAQQRADLYAKSLGLRVRRVVSIAEGRSGGGFRPLMMSARSKSMMDTPVAAGESTLSVNLDVVFELGK
jgi:uncharacterized protein YggE